MQVGRGIPPRLTARQREVLCLHASGLTDKEIGPALGISIRMVRYHLEHCRRRFGVLSRSQLVGLAVHQGILHVMRRTKG